MNTGTVLLLNVVLLGFTLGAYHVTVRAGADAREPGRPARTHEATPRPTADPVLVARLDEDARRLSALEADIRLTRAALADVTIAVAPGETRSQDLGEARLAALEREILEVRSRRLFERRTQHLQVAVDELGLDLTIVERRAVVETIQASHDEVGRHAQALRERQRPIDSGAINAGYDEILKRYHEKIRSLVAPGQAEKIIARFLPLR